MFNNSQEILNRQFREFPLNKTQSEGLPYYHQVLNDQRNAFGGYQPQLQQKKIFGFEIFVDNDIIREMGGQSKWFENIVKAGSVESVKFNLDLNIPDLNGRNIQVYDKEMDRKYQSCRTLLSDIYQVFKRIKRQPFSVIIFVPQGMVSLLIGTRGYQINKIMKESHTTIVVNQPINRMTYRTVKIQGYHSDIARACKIIYQILEDKSSIAYSIEKQPSQLDYTKARVKTKFIFTNSILNYLQYKKKFFLKKIEEQTKCLIKFRQDNSSRLLKKQQDLCVLLGKLEDVQAVLVMMINLIQIYYDQEKKNYDYTFKMLIPSNYVTKLIGQKGYMIRDIIDRSGGAQIKIMSDKQAQRDARQCIISINGTKQNKIDAACLILEQIQCFKNGGPILQSGKSINQNLAQQFKNSIPLRKQQTQQQIIFTQIKDFKFQVKEKINQFEHQIKIQQSINKFIKSIPKQFSDNDNKEEQGLIQGQVQHSIVNNNCTPTNEEIYPKHSSPIKIQEEKFQQKQQSPSSNPVKQIDKENKSESQSIELRQDKQIVELKLVVPRRLGTDQNHCEIMVKEQRIQSSTQMIIGIRGSMKNNSHCLKLLQKRIIRIAAQSSYGR